MSKPQLHAESLSLEVYHNILKRLDKKDIYNCALVCKAWLIPAKTLLYTDVELKHFKQLERFHRTVEHNLQLSMMVKCFTLKDSLRGNWLTFRSEALHILDALFSTCLLNLETLRDEAAISYTVVKLALMDSGLKSLKRIIIAFSYRLSKIELAEYMSCALLMKDRLENLYFSDIFDEDIDRMLFYQLRNRLGQFSRLKQLTIEAKVTKEGAGFLDGIIESCSPTLEEVIFYGPSDHTLQNGNPIVSMDSITRNFVPRTSIKRLIVHQYSDEILTYIMHKFPQLDECSLHTEWYVSSEVVERFLNYAYRLKDYILNDLIVDHEMITAFVNNLWKGGSSALGKKHVNFTYSEEESESGVNVLSVYKHSACIRYPLPWSARNRLPNWKHIKFLQKNGRLLKSLAYTFSVYGELHKAENTTLPDDIIAHTFAYCPSIQYLDFDHCTLTLANTLLPSGGTHSLRKLSLDRCRIYEGTLEWLSKVLSKVEHLKLSNVCCVPEQEDSIPETIEVIKMPDTEVDLITFGVTRYSPRFVKITNSTDETSTHYYALQVNRADAFPSTEEEFLGASIDQRSEVCCKSNPIIKSEYNFFDIAVFE